jgi:hypothetical protein
METLRRWYFMGAFLYSAVRAHRDPRRVTRCHILPRDDGRSLGATPMPTSGHRGNLCRAHTTNTTLIAPAVPFVSLFDTELSREWNAQCCACDYTQHSSDCRSGESHRSRACSPRADVFPYGDTVTRRRGKRGADSDPTRGKSYGKRNGSPTLCRSTSRRARSRTA